MFGTPQDEHAWLQKMIGEWTFESECLGEPGKPPTKFCGVEKVEALGGFWVQGISEGDCPGTGKPTKNIITMGFDPLQNAFVGTFVSSMMAQLWVYHGTLDASKKILTLNTQGPRFTGKGMAKYIDTIEWIDDGHRTLSSQVQGEDGAWTKFMTGHYRRKK